MQNNTKTTVRPMCAKKVVQIGGKTTYIQQYMVKKPSGLTIQTTKPPKK